MGILGFNRNVNTGAILNGSYGAYQLHNYQGKLQLQVYNSSGTAVDQNALVVDNSANVGIGTASPQTKLEVKTAKDNINTILSAPLATIGNTTAYLNYQDLEFRNNYVNTTGTAKVRLRHHSNLYVNSGSQFSIATSTTGGTITEALRVDHSQNVGIGTSSPDSKLEVSGSGVTAVKITGSYPVLHFDDADTGAYIANNANGLFIGKTNSPSSSNDIMKLDLTNSRVGIGTGSPDEKLHIFGAAPFIKIENSTETSGGILMVDQQDEGQNASIRFDASARSLDFLVDSGEAMTISSGASGRNVGIGTTSPNQLLHIGSRGTASDPSISTSLDGIMFDFYNAGNPYQRKASIISNSADNSEAIMAFWTTAASGSASQKMTINGAGNVGIGTTSPQSKFQVKQTSTNSAITSVNPAIVINNQGGSYTDGHYYSSIMFAKANSNGATKGAAIAPVIQDSGNSTELSFSTIVNGSALTEALRIDKTQDAHFDQDVIAFSTTPSDIRLKENFTKIENGLDVVNKLEGHTFNWKKGGDRLSAGFKAQEVEKILPHLVDEKKLPLKADDDKEYKILRYEEMIPYLVEAIKEQQETNKEELKGIING